MLVLCLSVFWSSCFVFMQFQRGIFNFFASCDNLHNVFLLVYFSWNPQAGYMSYRTFWPWSFVQLYMKIYHAYTCFLHLQALLSASPITSPQLHSRFYDSESSSLLPRNIEWQTYSDTSKLNEQRPNHFPIYLITYNMPPVFSFITWYSIRDHDLVYINCKYVSSLILPAKILNLFCI